MKQNAHRFILHPSSFILSPVHSLSTSFCYNAGMKQRTLILRLWRDASGGLHVQLRDPVRELDARFTGADALWDTLQAWINPLHAPNLETFSDADRSPLAAKPAED